MAYNDISESDSVSPAWGNMVEDALGGKSIFTTNVYPAQGATYTVFKSGSYYCARDGLTGKIDFDDTDFTTLMNETILDMYNSASGNGGLIHIKAGQYTVATQINMRPGIFIQGEGITGGIGPYALYTQLHTSTTDTIVFSFDYPTPTTAHYFSGIARMHIHGPEVVAPATSTKPLIDMQCNSNYLSDVYFSEVYADSAKYSWRIYNNAAATYKIWNIWIDRCLPENDTANGILIDSPTNQIIERVRITNCHFYGNNSSTGNGALEIDGHSTYCGLIANNTFDLENKHGIYLNDEADHWAITGNVMKDGGAAGANTYSGIYLNDVDYISVTGNNIGNITTANLKYGVEMDANSTYCLVTNNVLGGATAGALKGAGTGNIVRNNVGFITENSGTGTITNPATTAVIAHGLSVTPTVDDIHITWAENATNAITAWWVDTIGAANFTVNCEPAPGASNLDFGWQVIVL